MTLQNNLNDDENALEGDLLGLIIAVLILVIGLALSGTAESAEKDTSLLLAKSCVSEISFRKSPRECFLMWEINGRHAALRGRTIDSQARKYNSYWKIPKKRRKRNWIAGLDRSGDSPALWPLSYDWEKYKGAWMRTVAAADLFLEEWNDGTYNHRCPQADDYGAPGMDIPKTPCSRPTKCYKGRTLQRYWDSRGCKKK